MHKVVLFSFALFSSLSFFLFFFFSCFSSKWFEVGSTGFAAILLFLCFFFFFV